MFSCRTNPCRLLSRSSETYSSSPIGVSCLSKQSLTGRKVEYLIIPYRAITSYSIENAGTFDMDSELKIWVSGRADPIQKLLKSGTNIRGIQAAIASAL